MKFGDGVDRASLAFDIERVLLALERRQPEVVDPHHRVGHHLKQFLAAGAIPLQRLDHIDPLLQHGLLALELLHFALDLLEAGLFGAQSAKFERSSRRAGASAGSR